MNTTLDQQIEDMKTAPPCMCKRDPLTWIVDDPIDGMVICFGCGNCGAAWTRVASDPLQKQHARIQQRKAAKELMRMGFTPA